MAAQKKIRLRRMPAEFIGPRAPVPKRTYGKVAQAQIKRAYTTFNRLNQPEVLFHEHNARRLFPRDKHGKLTLERGPDGRYVRPNLTREQVDQMPLLKAWEPKVSTEAARKSLPRLFRLKRSPQQGRYDRVKIDQAKLTSEGMYRKLLYIGAKREWEKMRPTAQKLYAKTVIRIVAKYVEAKSRRKGQTRRKLTEIRTNILAELRDTRREIEGVIEHHRPMMGEFSKEQMARKLTVIDGIIHGIESGKFKTSVEPKKISPKAAQQLVKAGGRAIVEEWARKASEVKRPPVHSESTRESHRGQDFAEEVRAGQARVREFLDQRAILGNARRNIQDEIDVLTEARRMVREEPLRPLEQVLNQALLRVAKEKIGERAQPIEIRYTGINAEDDRRRYAAQRAERTIDVPAQARNVESEKPFSSNRLPPRDVQAEPSSDSRARRAGRAIARLWRRFRRRREE